MRSPRICIRPVLRRSSPSLPKRSSRYWSLCKLCPVGARELAPDCPRSALCRRMHSGLGSGEFLAFIGDRRKFTCICGERQTAGHSSSRFAVYSPDEGEPLSSDRTYQWFRSASFLRKICCGETKLAYALLDQTVTVIMNSPLTWRRQAVTYLPVSCCLPPSRRALCME